MPEPSWEAATTAWAHGFLKFLDFQGDGFDVHATFQKSKTIHVSVYVVSAKKDDTKLGMQPMTFGVTGVSLDESKRLLVKNIVSPNADMPADFWAFFENRCTAKATELNIFAPQQTAASQPAITTTSTVQKGGGSGIPKGANWGDAQKKAQFDKTFPSL